MGHRKRYAVVLAMARRRRRRKLIVKLDEFAKCRWFVGRGMPVGYIAEKLHVSETTVRKWRSWMDTDHAFTELRRRVMQLPEWRRDQLATDLVDDHERRARGVSLKRSSS